MKQLTCLNVSNIKCNVTEMANLVSLIALRLSPKRSVKHTLVVSVRAFSERSTKGEYCPKCGQHNTVGWGTE
jgi:hypothetical protein